MKTTAELQDELRHIINTTVDLGDADVDTMIDRIVSWHLVTDDETPPVKKHKWYHYANGTFCENCGRHVTAPDPCTN